MMFRLRVKNKETGEVWFEQVVEAVSEEQARRMLRYHIEAWKWEEIEKNPDKFEIIIERLDSIIKH